MRKKETHIIHALQKTVDELRKSKLIDPLTGLLNREGFKNILSEKCNSNKEFLVAYADLDKFKEINDFMGHAVGDLVLKISSARMSSILGMNSPVARLGGDEFAFVIPGEKSMALQRCQELIEKITQPIALGERTFSIGISIGVSSYPHQATALEELLDKADMAMYAAKCSHARQRRHVAKPRPAHRRQRAGHRSRPVAQGRHPARPDADGASGQPAGGRIPHSAGAGGGQSSQGLHGRPGPSDPDRRHPLHPVWPGTGPASLYRLRHLRGRCRRGQPGLGHHLAVQIGRAHV